MTAGRARIATRVATALLLVLALPLEWSLAVHTLAFSPWLAWIVQVIVELHLWVALQARRGVPLAATIFLASLLTSSGAHLVTSSGGEITRTAQNLLLTGFLATALVSVIWGLDRIARDLEVKEGRAVETKVDARDAGLVEGSAAKRPSTGGQSGDPLTAQTRPAAHVPRRAAPRRGRANSRAAAVRAAVEERYGTGPRPYPSVMARELGIPRLHIVDAYKPPKTPRRTVERELDTTKNFTDKGLAA